MWARALPWKLLVAHTVRVAVVAIDLLAISRGVFVNIELNDVRWLV